MSKRVLITGGNSGIGFCTAEQLVARGAEVILACRDQTKGQAAIAKIKNAFSFICHNKRLCFQITE